MFIKLFVLTVALMVDNAWDQTHACVHLDGLEIIAHKVCKYVMKAHVVLRLYT